MNADQAPDSSAAPPSNALVPGPDQPLGWKEGIVSYLVELSACRLCRTVALWVLLSILLVEGAILFPSYRNYERDLLLRLRDIGDAVASAAINQSDALSEADLRQAGQRMLGHRWVVGGAFYGAGGDAKISFGEVPALQPLQPGGSARSSDGRRYAVVARPGPAPSPLSIVVNLDSSWIGGELTAFVFRITGLVLLITAITVMATMAVLGRFVLRPLLHLRGRLAAAALAPENPELFTVRPRRGDEMGDLFNHFNTMIRNVSSAHREARERLAMMVENSQNAVFAFTPDGKASYLNRAALQHCGVADFENLQAGDIPAIESDDGGSLQLEHYLSQAPAVSEPVMIRHDGKRISCSLRHDRLRDSSGNIVLDYAFVLDISAQKQALAALADSETRFRTIFEQSLNAIVLADKERQVIVDFNAATCRVFEYHRGSLLGQPLRVLLGDGVAEAFDGKTELHRIEPVACITGEGRGIEVEASIAEIEIDGRSHFLAHISDVTERQQTERALRDAKEAADAASRGKSAFLTAMSHELRTPLNAIIGFSSILKAEFTGTEGAESQLEYAGLIEGSGHDLLHILQQIMDLSQLESDEVNINDELNEIPVLFAQAVRDSAAQIKDKHVEVAIEAAADLPALRGDTRLLGQLLVNLLTNARKFTNAGDAIKLSAGLTEQGDLALIVADNGVGIAAERIGTVMEPFVQAGDELARADTGIGLGLPLANKFAELHDAAIALESEEGAGTTITVTFPAKRLVALDAIEN